MFRNCSCFRKKRSDSHISVGEVFCKESTTSTSNGTFYWPMTKIGTDVTIPCHANVATRHCSSGEMVGLEMPTNQYGTSPKGSPFTGVWQEPDMSQCYNTERITQQLKNITSEDINEESFSRMLDIIEAIPEEIPLEEPQLTVLHPNLGIGAIKVEKDTFNGAVYGISFGNNESEAKTMVTQNSSTKANTMINSNIIAANIPNIKVTNLDEPVNISFNLRDQNATNPQCVFWDESPGQIPKWSTKGCNVSKYEPGKKVLCSCDHLTSFALLVSKIMTTS
ncbi:adhesion G-protein coupled receptor G6-like [Octopus vulgaris]|uniref:Adhesion G-protein coupled receptor G6-like n=1 Tax=Octopus vulgaris TaxID=6645 RepID=A0AA36BZZ1_OCTVU|nr:adhesion G-protein coupled receptor G6-like [Octopus vulgaris]